jgi:hypothetical protein
LRTPAHALVAAGETTWARATISPSRLGQKRPNNARHDLDRRMEINGCARVSGEQNPLPTASRVTLAHSVPQCLLLPHPSKRESGGGRRRSEPRHGEPPRRRARPPQGERAAVERHHRGAQIRRATSGTAAARTASVRARPKASRGRVEGAEDGRSGASRRYRAQTRSARFVLSVGWRRPVNLASRAAGPHLSFIARRDGSPPARKELERPDQGAEVSRPFGPVRVRWPREIKN